MNINPQRVLIWFSCGASSAVAAHLGVEKYPDAQVVYCNTMKSEHPDNERFIVAIEQKIGREIVRLNSKFQTVDDVFMKERYMSGIAGARCTVEMKKVPRFAYQRPDDLHVFGLTADEGPRIRTFEQNNPELYLEWILRDGFIRKADCHRMLGEWGIKEPEMYSLGFEHNNCLGCVKSQSPAYWNRTRHFFPEVFKRRCEQSRELGVRLIKIKGVRSFLDELPPSFISSEPDGDIECGPYCATEQSELPLTA